MASMSTYFFAVNPKSHSLSFYPKPFKPSRFRNFTPLPSPILRRATKFRRRKTAVLVIRASSSSNSVDVSSASAIRPGGSVESDKLPSDVRKRAMDAIDSSGRRVTIGDVASKAGLKLNEAQKALQALAADADGFLEVSDEGDVLYVFPKDYRSKLAAKSFRVKIEPLLEKGKMAIEYLVRVSFGTALIASIVLVYTTIIAIASSSRYKFQALNAHHLVLKMILLLYRLSFSYSFSCSWFPAVSQTAVAGGEDLMTLVSLFISVQLIYSGNISNS